MAEVDTLERREDGGRAVALKDQPIRWVQEGEEGGGSVRAGTNGGEWRKTIRTRQYRAQSTEGVEAGAASVKSTRVLDLTMTMEQQPVNERLNQGYARKGGSNSSCWQRIPIILQSFSPTGGTTLHRVPFPDLLSRGAFRFSVSVLPVSTVAIPNVVLRRK